MYFTWPGRGGEKGEKEGGREGGKEKVGEGRVGSQYPALPDSALSVARCLLPSCALDRYAWRGERSDIRREA